MPNFPVAGPAGGMVPRFARYCLFLNVDGTLVEFAATPGEVRVEPSLTALIDQASQARCHQRGGQPTVAVRGHGVLPEDGYRSGRHPILRVPEPSRAGAGEGTGERVSLQGVLPGVTFLSALAVFIQSL